VSEDVAVLLSAVGLVLRVDERVDMRVNEGERVE
jgi:hypothetical protein